MMRLMQAALAATSVFVLALATPASAQEAKPEEKKVRSFDFDGDQIDGDQIRPDGDMINVRELAKRTSLIKIRTDFVREILKSAEDL